MNNHLKFWRNHAELTQTQLSDYSGVSAATISGIENDQHNPLEATMIKLASALGVVIPVIWPDYRYGDK